MRDAVRPENICNTMPCRFSKAEKETLKAAAAEYAKEKGLSEDNFDWLFNTRTTEQRELTSGAWKAIANNALPQRSVRSVWACGTRILHPNHYKVSSIDTPHRRDVSLTRRTDPFC